MSKSHPLTKLQLLLAILSAISCLVFLEAEEPKQFFWFIIVIVPFVGVNIISVYLGWLMVIKKEDIISPMESFFIRFTEKTRGNQAAKILMAEYSKPSRKMLIGGIDIFAGLLCILVIVGFVIILRT